MSEHKQQHYVPRCYLKPFSLGAVGSAINLYNLPRNRAVRNAPVKGQCAKIYLYGTSLGLERALQPFEGEYARILRLLQDPSTPPTEDDLNALRAFAYLQYARTDMAIQRLRWLHNQMIDTMFKGRPVNPPDLDLSDRAMMRTSIGLYSQIREYIDDLKVCIVKNETGTDFVTSDDPSIFTSRFYLQRLRDNAFGIANSGALLFLPLTPHMLLMCYDGQVYTIPDKRGCYVSITNIDDAFALNELQYLHAAANIYFARWDDRDRIDREFREVKPRRPVSWSRTRVFVPVAVSEKGEYYRAATEIERTTAPETLFMSSSLHPAPSIWVSKLKYRSPIRTHFNGSAVGHVRMQKWLEPDRRRRPRE